MQTPNGIVFNEVDLNPEDFLRRLNDSHELRRSKLPPGSARAIRKRQVTRLEANVSFLRKKQEEFNRRMEDYVRSLQLLINGIHKSLESAPPPEESPSTAPEGIRVNCLGCGQVKIFKNMLVIVARDSLDSLAEPTEVIVDHAGEIKKGSFRCPACGDHQLQIKDLSLMT